MNFCQLRKEHSGLCDWRNLQKGALRNKKQPKRKHFLLNVPYPVIYRRPLKCSRVLGAPFQSVEFALNFLAFGSVAHGLIAFETVLQGEHQARLFIRFLCVHFLFVFVGCVKMTILVSLQRCVRIVKSRTPRMRAQEVKYMINSDSHAADWLLWHTARLHIFFCLVFSYSLLVIVKQR